MDVPLAAYRSIVNDRQYIDVWTSRGMERVPAPFLPYAYSKRQRAVQAAKAEQTVVRPLSSLREETWWRYEFPTVRGVSEMSRDEAPLEMADNHVAFVERVLIDDPAWFKRFPHGRAPRLMVLDIEQLTTGSGFPSEREPLIAIGWCVDDGAPECVLTDGKDDKPALEALLAAVERADPDVLVGYNIAGYDLPMVVKRLRANGLDPRRLTRGQRGVSEEDDEMTLEGRLVYDVYQSVKLDQTLHGIKDRTLKTVGAWMQLPVVKEDMSDTRALVGTERLRTYNLSDVALTRDLGRIYWRNYVALAEFYGAPLSVVLRATPIFHTNILQGRVFHKASPRIVSDGTNEQRYAGLYAEAGGQAFIGGFVAIYQTGLFEPLWKIDFSSMYPSIMVSLGCGADNTRFVGEEPKGPFAVRQDDGKRVYSIPDESRNKNLLVEIAGVSPLALQLKDLLQLRMLLKRQAKETKDKTERERLVARQNVIKVVLNSIYGNMASGFARYGALPVAVATVGVARELIKVVERELGDSKVETDTDGVYASKQVDVVAINEAIDGYVSRGLGGENFMRVEVEKYRAGYFHKAKSYLLLHEDGRIEKHGIAFKGSSLCGVFDKTLEAVSEALLLRKGDPRTVGREAFDMSRYKTPED
ncbi:MAG TPA: DNA polymerase domain-containing protein, partial [Candidatus Thermoplasmatota archaeon]|nr:DNA polymerase domain-containing protein [Candidatus Thermoplasmatota archaeon]